MHEDKYFSVSYKYPIGKNIHIDLSSAIKPIESNRIHVSEEQFSIYSDMDTCFELCKICSVNNKNSKIQPCGHLLCQNCLIAWQVEFIDFLNLLENLFFKNQNCSKPPPLCPFCRSEIKGFESVIIKPFNTNESNPIVQNLETLATARTINNENSSSDNTSPPPPIPPRPVNLKSTINRSPVNNLRRFEEILLPPLHNNDVLLLPQQRPISSNEILSSISNASENETLDDIRNRLKSEFNFEQTRIEAALVLTDGLALSKQYEMAKSFLNQVKYEQEQFLKDPLQT